MTRVLPGPCSQTIICANGEPVVVDLTRWMYTYPKPEHVFPVVDWQDGLPVVAATGALVKLVASQADPTFPALDVDSPALWDAVLLFRRFKFGPDEPTIAATFRLALLRRPADPGLLTNLLIFSLVYWPDTVPHARDAIERAGLAYDDMRPFLDRALEAGVVIDPDHVLA